MQPASPIRTDLVLLGAGHAHVEVLRRFAMRPEPGVRLTLIGREPETPYSGMLPGLIRGDYGFDQAHIDLAPLTAAAGARLILAEATGLDLDQRAVRIAGRPPLPYDLLSIDIGGEPAMPPGAGIPVKPIGRFLDRLATLAGALPAGARIAVVGGGPAGAELALALVHRLGSRARIALVSESAEPHRRRAGACAPGGARGAGGCRRGADQRRARHRPGGRPAEPVGRQRDHGGGRVVGHRRGGAGVPRRLRPGLRRGRVRRRWTPRCKASATPACSPPATARRWRDTRCPRPASGRCAPADRWLATSAAPRAGQKLRRWRPQSDALVILGLGGGKAVAWRNGLAVSGRLVWRWKDRIDRRWMRMYQQPMRPMAAGPDMRCGGCGAKVGAEILAGALAALPRMPGADVLIGLDVPDDAAVLAPPPGQAIVQSVDYFRAFIDDPFVFGQIAAAHALSDLHAMGARPWSALAVAAVPFASGDRMRAELSAMLLGAAEVLRADGCTLVGGHSAEAAESALGFAVTGLADAARLWRKSGLRPGDALVLTKKLGTGIVLAGHMRGMAKAAWLLAALDSMRASNGAAAAVLRAHGVTACTDVTGFGLAGHLLELLRASRVAAELWPDAVPALPGALELAALGIESTLAPENRRLLPDADGDVRTALLVDPQTSGGLLAGVPGERAEACVAALLGAGVPAAVVGWVQPGVDGERLLRLERAGGAPA